MGIAVRTLSLVKGHDYFRIDFEIGSETLVIEALIGMVKQPRLNFDWFDAAMLAKEIGVNLKTFISKTQVT